MFPLNALEESKLNICDFSYLKNELLAEVKAISINLDSFLGLKMPLQYNPGLNAVRMHT